MPRRKSNPNSNCKPLAYSYVRFSSNKQASGDSYRRQSEAADEWAQQNGLKIVESYQDLGVSAYRGAHSAHGHLARFLKAVRGGSIPPGSYLIIESLDRLSRAEIPDALSQFLEIIRAGIVVVTLMDQKIYTRESIAKDISDIMISLVIMSRANEESRTKSRRCAEVWDKKRRQALSGEFVYFGNGPAWLNFNRTKNRWEVDPEKGETIRKIFELYASGVGSIGVARQLNREKWPVFANSTGWHTSTVRRLLSNRAVLGERAFFKEEDDGKSVPIPGLEPIPNYYPQVIDPALFAKVQTLRKASPGCKGRTTDQNIFRGLLRTPGGDHFLYIKRTTKKKTFRYLIPGRCFRGMDRYISWKFEDFRDKFLFLIKAASERPAPQAKRDPRVAKLENELAQTKDQIARAMDVLLRVASPELETKLRELESAKASAEERLETLKMEEQAQTALTPLREINWDDNESLASNIRATVRKVIIDIPARSFKVTLFDGREYSCTDDGKRVKLTAPKGELKID